MYGFSSIQSLTKIILIEKYFLDNMNHIHFSSRPTSNPMVLSMTMIIFRRPLLFSSSINIHYSEICNLIYVHSTHEVFPQQTVGAFIDHSEHSTLHHTDTGRVDGPTSHHTSVITIHILLPRPEYLSPG